MQEILCVLLALLSINILIYYVCVPAFLLRTAHPFTLTKQVPGVSMYLIIHVSAARLTDLGYTDPEDGDILSVGVGNQELRGLLVDVLGVDIDTRVEDANIDNDTDVPDVEETLEDDEEEEESEG